MKKDPLPEYLKEEIRNLVKKKPTYTQEEINQTKRDYKYVKKQLVRLEEAQKYKAIPEYEALITRMLLIGKQALIEETMQDIKRYNEDKKRAFEESIN